MTGKYVPYGIGDVPFMISQVQRLYSDPHKAFKEYITNAFDSKMGDKTLTIVVYIDRNKGILLVQDDGKGMSAEFLASLPRRPGSSIKRGLEGVIGEKGLGILSFPSVGARACKVYSKPHNSTEDYFNYLLMTDDPSKHPWVDQITPDKLISDGAGNVFPHGTRIIMSGVPKETIDRYFTPAKIEDVVSNIFAPLLRQGEVVVRVGYIGRTTKTNQVEPPKYKGELVLDERGVEVDFKDKEGRHKKGLIDFLLFVNPTGNVERVGLYNRGVMVMENLANLSELSHLPWLSGKLNGEINQTFLELTPSREAPVRDHMRYPIFLRTLRLREGDLNMEVERLHQNQRKNAQQDWATKCLSTINAVWKNYLEEHSVLILGRKGDLEKKVSIVTPKGANGRVGGERDEKVKIPGRDHVVESIDGEKKPVRDGVEREVEISQNYRPVFEDFYQENEKTLRSILDPAFGVIRINIGHEDYQRSEGKDLKVLRRYIAHLLCKEIAFGEVSKLMKDNSPVPGNNEHLHLLTEMQVEFFQRCIHDHRIE